VHRPVATDQPGFRWLWAARVRRGLPALCDPRPGIHARHPRTRVRGRRPVEPAGAALASRVGRRLGAPRAVAAGIALTGGALLLVPLAGGATTAGLILLVAQQLVGDGAYTIASVHELSLRQARVPAALLGRATAAKRLLDTGAMGAGALAAGVIGQGDLRWALAVAGVVPLLAGVAIARLGAGRPANA
jgi:hypothetical protein